MCSEYFSGFTKFFKPQQIGMLKTMDQHPSKDRAFISLSVKCLFGEDLTSLKNKTVTGKYGTKKICPEKMMVLKKIYQERIDSINLENQYDADMRKGRFNSLLSRILYANTNGKILSSSSVTFR